MVKEKAVKQQRRNYQGTRETESSREDQISKETKAGIMEGDNLEERGGIVKAGSGKRTVIGDHSLKRRRLTKKRNPHGAILSQGPKN